MKLDAQIPEGPLQEKWTLYKSQVRLINAANKKKLDIIVVGAGLAGASAAASFAELGYNVKVFCFQDSPRRSHSVAAQGGINAAKNYKNDGDNIYRLFFDTIKGGDYRSREANVYRLAELSGNVIDQCVAQGVPFAREYGGMLDNRSFGGVQVQRTFYARGQTGQQILMGAYSALSRQIKTGKVKSFTRREMLDIVVIDGKARGVIARNLINGELECHSAHAVVLATGGYAKAFYLSTMAMNCNVTAIWKAYRKGACFANPSLIQIHPTSLPPFGGFQGKLTLMSEALRNDGRIWVPKEKDLTKNVHEIKEDQRDYFLERKYPSFGNLAPRDISSRSIKEVCDAGYGIGPGGKGVYLDFHDAIKQHGKKIIAERYGNLFDMYQTITGQDPYQVPMQIYPAAHFSMGGLWVDYHLMTTIPGLFAIGECNFADHGANRLGANSLLQTCVDGYFIVPLTIGDYLADEIKTGKIPTDHPAFSKAKQGAKDQIERLLAINGKQSVDQFHKRLGETLWNNCGINRNAGDLEKAIKTIKDLRSEFWQDVKVVGSSNEVNPELEKGGRVADFLELAELMCHDALNRDESCGAHFRKEHQTEDGEGVRNDQEFAYVAAWQKNNEKPLLHKEELKFETVKPTVRSYK